MTPTAIEQAAAATATTRETHREERMKRSFGYHLLRAISGPVVQRLWIGKVAGLEEIPRSEPYIVISNHASYLDFILLSTLFEYGVGRPIHFWAKRKVVEAHPLFRHYARHFQAVLVDRGCHDYWHTSLDHLSAGRVIGIFPEGSRSRTGKLQRFHTGYLRLAARAQVPVVPIELKGAYDILPPHRRWPRLTKSDIVVHPPFTVPADLEQEAMAALNLGVRERYFSGNGAAQGAR